LPRVVCTRLDQKIGIPENALVCGPQNIWGSITMNLRQRRGLAHLAIVPEREDKKGMLYNTLVITLLFLIVLVLFIAYRAG
jgi:hypothetical protein